MAILYPNQKVVLVESDRRKAEFLKHTLATLGLSNASVLISRVEALPDESISAAVCRGFASLSKTLLIARRIFKTGGKLYNLKGPEWSFEIASIPGQICSTWNTHLLGEYRLPETDIGHCVVVAAKTK
jgi:16S rRNA (guanine527-N7)-methyltransferase